MVIDAPIIKLIFLDAQANDNFVNEAPIIAETAGMPTSNICIIAGLNDTFHLSNKTSLVKDDVWDKAKPIRIPEKAMIAATPKEWQ
jgi:hypothetical protein